MKKILFVFLTLAFTLTIFSTANLPMAHAGSMLKMVAIEAKSLGQVKELARMGIDISEAVKGPLVKGPRGVPMQTYRVEAVVSARDEKKRKRQLKHPIGWPALFRSEDCSHRAQRLTAMESGSIF